MDIQHDQSGARHGARRLEDTAGEGPLASLRGVGKHYGAVVALDDVDMDLHGGEIMALLGANGAGKSTAVALLLGLVDADRGGVSLLGRSPHDIAARRGIGVMLQSAVLPERARVGELLDLTRSYYAAPRSTAHCIELAGLYGLMARNYGALSGGQQRRVQFALAICGHPRVLFLDEPTTGLDIDARAGLWRSVRALADEGAAVLLTTHYLEEAQALADHVTVLAHGRVVAAGSMDAIRARAMHRRIRCRSALDVATVAQWPGVAQALRDGDALQLVVAAGTEAIVAQLLARDPALADLEVTRAGLDEVFAALTREADAAALQEAA